MSTNKSKTRGVKKKSSIYDIKAKFVHLNIGSYLPKIVLLRLAKHSKRYQQLMDLTKEDYEIYSLQYQSDEKEYSFKNRNEEESLSLIKSIADITKASVLCADNSEIKVPSTPFSILETKDYIAVGTQMNILVYNKFTFSLIKEYNTKCQGAVDKMILYKENIILYGSFINSTVFFNLENGDILYEIEGNCPVLIDNDKLAYVWEDKEIRMVSLNSIMELDYIPLGDIFKAEEDEASIVSSMIYLKSNNHLFLATWSLTLVEYDIKQKECLEIFLIGLEFISYLYELKDERIILLAEDNPKIYVLDRKEFEVNLSNGKVKKGLNYLTGHKVAVNQLIQLEDEQMVSASSDGKIIFWIKDLEDNTFSISLVIFLYYSYLRKIIKLKDGRLCTISDEKVIRILGLNNYLENFKINYLPYNDDEDTLGNYFELIDDTYL